MSTLSTLITRLPLHPTEQSLLICQYLVTPQFSDITILILILAILFLQCILYHRWSSIWSIICLLFSVNKIFSISQLNNICPSPPRWSDVLPHCSEWLLVFLHLCDDHIWLVDVTPFVFFGLVLTRKNHTSFTSLGWTGRLQYIPMTGLGTHWNTWWLDCLEVFRLNLVVYVYWRVLTTYSALAETTVELHRFFFTQHILGLLGKILKRIIWNFLRGLLGWDLSLVWWVSVTVRWLVLTLFLSYTVTRVWHLISFMRNCIRNILCNVCYFILI